MANKSEPLITVDEVQEILAEPKETVKPVAWVPKPAANNVQWMEFSSPCKVKGEVREDVIFRVTYRAARTDVHGQATIFLAETFCASLFVGPHRVRRGYRRLFPYQPGGRRPAACSASRWPTAATSICGWTRAKAMPSR